MSQGGKRRLRKRLRAARRALDQETRRAATERMNRHLERVAAQADARTLAVYAATKGEADPSPAIAKWLESGCAVAWPRVVGEGELAFHALVDPRDLEPGYRGILEPPAEAPRLELAAFDVLVVPGVGFDLSGRRLGQGGGFYDRLLASPERRALAVGLAFHVQLCERVPVEPHDLPVEAVVTERGVARGGEWDPELA